MEVKFKKLHEDAVIPTKAHSTDAGFDLTCISFEEDPVKEIVTYHTGIAMEIPKGYVGLVFPRSSVYKVQLQLSNSVGIIDSCYRGEIMFKYRIVKPHIRRFGLWDRIGQIIIMPYPEIDFVEVTELDDSDRGTGGYGSSGK